MYDDEQELASDELDLVLAGIGARLKAIRLKRAMTLAELSAETRVSLSTLSRLESGLRRPTLRQLLRLAHSHRVTLDELVGAPPTGDPRVNLRPVIRHGVTLLPLTRRPGGVQAYKMIVPVRDATVARQQTHDGYDWLFVLSGRLRLLLGATDVILREGEVAEFDTRTPHWFGSVGPGPSEVLGMFGPQGERLQPT